MKALTKQQQAALDKIKIALDQSSINRYHAYTYFKNSWCRNGHHEGIARPVLEALERKGYVKLRAESFRKTGVYNPVAESWGYSTYIYDIVAELI